MDIETMQMTHNQKSFFFLGLEEVLGPKELANLMAQEPVIQNRCEDAPAALIGTIRKKMDEVYGMLSARGLAICSGRAAFKHLMSQQRDELGLDKPEFLLLPTQLKVNRGLGILSKWLGEKYGNEITLVNTQAKIEMEVKSRQTPIAANDHICDFTYGLIQEFLAWISGGKFYAVHETKCRVSGDDYCKFQIDKYSIDG